MPCWTQTSLNVDLQVANRGLLAEALTSLGYQVELTQYGLEAQQGSVSLTWADGKLNVQSRRALDESTLSKEIRQAYSRAVVKKATKKFGWTEQAGKQQNQVVLRRRA